MKKFKLGLAKVLVGYYIIREAVSFLNDVISLVEKLMSYIGIALNYFYPRYALTYGAVGK